MQPCAPTPHPIPATRTAAGDASTMSTPTAARTPAGNAFGWPLRLAQRAFAALLGEPRGGAPASAFRSAQLRSAAQRTLSTLSADDAAQLARWLALQLATTKARAATHAASRLARVDARLAANVEAAARRAREALFAPRRDAAAA